jgi:death-on-curing protein
MIEIQEVLIIHDILITEFGGSNGVRDYNLLASAINRPFSGIDNLEFYPSIHEKAGVLIESIVKNHPFVDGNKRTGYVIMRLFLLNNGYDIEATQDEKYEFVMNVASGNLTIEQIISWISSRLKK